METNCHICHSGFLKTSHSSKTFCNFISNLTMFLNSTNSNSFGADEKDSIDFNKSSEKVYCCDQCSGDTETFCQMWDSRELLLVDIIRIVVTISNLIKSKGNKICQEETVNCFICQSKRNVKIEVAQECCRAVDRCKHFKLCLKRFLSNTKKPLFDKGILKEIERGDDYCCDKCVPEMETFCEIYEAIDSVQLELFRLLGKIFNNAKKKCDVNSFQNVPVFWQDFILKVEQRRKGHYPMVKLERVQFPNKAEVSGQIKVEANVNSDRYFDTMGTLKLEPVPPESEALALLPSSNLFHHSADILSTDVNSEGITMEFEPGLVTISKFKTEPIPVFENEVEKQAKWKGRWRHRNKEYQCLFCPSKYSAPSKLEIHLKTHTRETPYICRICLEEFKQRRTFLNHCRRNIHGSSSNEAQTVGKRLFQCNLCERRCFSRSDLILHHQRVHSNRRPFSCNICGAKFTARNSLRDHHSTQHDGKKIHKIHRKKCPICPETFTSYVSLRNHCLALHSEESLSYVCRFCGKSFFPKRILNYHVQMVHEKDFKCKLCGQEGLPTIEAGRQHLKTVHPDDSTFKCSYDGCEWTFYRNTERKQHMLTHNREKLFQCDHCQKMFATKKSLRLHINNKSCQKSAKPRKVFKCGYPGCDRVFNITSNLYTHRLFRHSKERNFQCNYCKRPFSTKYGLKIHMFVHKETQPFVCGQCGKGFALRARLKEHMRTHQK